jgi:hypothetical protein
MAQKDGQQQDAPQNADGIVVASFGAIPAKTFEEVGIGDGFEELTNGGECGAVVEAIPGEQRLGDGDAHGEISLRKKCVCSCEMFYNATHPHARDQLVEKNAQNRLEKAKTATCVGDGI